MTTVVDPDGTGTPAPGGMRVATRAAASTAGLWLGGAPGGRAVTPRRQAARASADGWMVMRARPGMSGVGERRRMVVR